MSGRNGLLALLLAVLESKDLQGDAPILAQVMVVLSARTIQ